MNPVKHSSASGGVLDGHKPLYKLDKSKQSRKKCAYWDDILIAQTR